MEILNDVDVSLTVNLTASTLHEVSEDCFVTATNQQQNKRTRQFIDKEKKV